MRKDLDEVVLQPGTAIEFKDRDDFLAKLDDLDRRVPSRSDGRTKDHREHYQMVRYLRFLGGGEAELLPLPVKLRKSAEGKDPPDFTLCWGDKKKETFELTDGSTQGYQKMLTVAKRRGEEAPLPVDPQISDHDAAQRWAEVLFHAFQRKATSLQRGRYSIDHLLIYDLTGLGIFVALEDGLPLLRKRIELWQQEQTSPYRFTRVSVLRDLGLLLDVTGGPRILTGKSRYFQLAFFRGGDEGEIKKRLREIDSFCRDRSIRHLKLFGSVLGDMVDALDGEDQQRDPVAAHFFRGGSDIDLLVEFEPGTRITLFDMANMQQRLSDLIGFPVDLKTANDLSRYFRTEVLEEAVELRARPA